MQARPHALCVRRQWALAEAAAERMRGLPGEMPAAYPPGDAGREWRELLTTRAWQVHMQNNCFFRSKSRARFRCKNKKFLNAGLSLQGVLLRPCAGRMSVPSRVSDYYCQRQPSQAARHAHPCSAFAA